MRTDRNVRVADNTTINTATKTDSTVGEEERLTQPSPDIEYKAGGK